MSSYKNDYRYYVPRENDGLMAVWEVPEGEYWGLLLLHPRSPSVDPDYNININNGAAST